MTCPKHWEHKVNSGIWPAIHRANNYQPASLIGRYASAWGNRETTESGHSGLETHISSHPGFQLAHVRQLFGMAGDSADTVHLRELAAKCRRIAASLSDEHDVASLRQMAAEYEAMVSAIGRLPTVSGSVEAGQLSPRMKLAWKSVLP